MIYGTRKQMERIILWKRPLIRKNSLEQSKMEDQLMEMVGGSESNVWKLYESIMCVYFDMEEIIKQAKFICRELMTGNGC